MAKFNIFAFTLAAIFMGHLLCEAGSTPIFEDNRHGQSLAGDPQGSSTVSAATTRKPKKSTTRQQTTATTVTTTKTTTAATTPNPTTSEIPTTTMSPSSEDTTTIMSTTSEIPTTTSEISTTSENPTTMSTTSEAPATTMSTTSENPTTTTTGEATTTTMSTTSENPTTTTSSEATTTMSTSDVPTTTTAATTSDIPKTTTSTTSENPTTTTQTTTTTIPTTTTTTSSTTTEPTTTTATPVTTTTSQIPTKTTEVPATTTTCDVTTTTEMPPTTTTTSAQSTTSCITTKGTTQEPTPTTTCSITTTTGRTTPTPITTTKAPITTGTPSEPTTTGTTTTECDGCKKTLYFAYGSNLWTNRIKENNPSVVKRYIGFLPDFKLEFGHYSKRWRGGVANIFPTPNTTVYGVLWEMQVKDLKSLDRQEGVKPGIYRRFKANITVEGRQREAWTYRLTDHTRIGSHMRYGRHLRPSVVYKDVIIRGANEHRLPTSYIRALNAIPAIGHMSDCGGIITLTSTNSPIIDYRGTNGLSRYGSNERCVWMIVPEPSVAIDKISIFIHHQDFGEDPSNDGLIFYDSQLKGQKLLKSDTGLLKEFDTPIGLLYFSSDESDEGSGFKVTIIGQQKNGTTLNDYQGYWMSAKNCALNFSYPPEVPEYSSDISNVMIVIQPDIGQSNWNSTKLKFQLDDPLSNSDMLNVSVLPVYKQNITLTSESAGMGTLEESRSSGDSKINFVKTTASTPRIVSFKPTTLTGAMAIQQECAKV